MWVDMRHRSRNARRGSAMLEAALIYGSFMFMLIAILDIGYTMFLHQTLVERARGAARYGVARTFDATAIQNKVLYNSPTIPSGATPIFGLQTSNVTVSQTAAIAMGSPSWLTVRISGWRFFRFMPNQTSRPTGQDISVTLPMENP
jgi:hypothetical protein